MISPLIPSLVFPHQVDTLTITSPTEAVDVRLTIDGTQRLAVTLYGELQPNGNQSFSTPGRYVAQISDLATLFHAYVDAEPAPCMLSVGPSTAPETVAFTVIPSRLNVDTDAATFCARHFLTLTDGIRLTCYGQTEVLTFYEPAAAEVEVTIVRSYWHDESFVTQTTTSTLSASAGYNTLRVAMMADGLHAAADLVSVDVTAGQRTQRFQISRPDTVPPVPMLFVNNFGCTEAFVLMGGIERTLKPSRQAAIVGGARRDYRIDASPTYEAHTGLLPTGMAPLLDDLATAADLSMSVNGRYVPVNVTDCDWKLWNTHDATTQAVFTLQESRRGVNLPWDTTGRIFDNTFDLTFD